MKILVIDASVSRESVTRILLGRVQSFLKGKGADCSLLALREHRDALVPLDEGSLLFRTDAIARSDYSSPMFDLAKRLQEADRILVCSPFYDLSVPALLKCYIEQTMVNGLTFEDLGDRAKGLLKAERLLFLSVSGYPISKENPDFATPYIKAISIMWGIPSFESLHFERKEVLESKGFGPTLSSKLEWLLEERKQKNGH